MSKEKPKIEIIKDIIRKHRVVFQLTLPLFMVGKNMTNCINRLRGSRTFYKNLREYRKKNQSNRFNREFGFDCKCLTDWYDSAGPTKVYFWQDLWAAKLVNQKNPKIHYDIGSRIDGFIANLASNRENIVLIDIRPLEVRIPGVDFLQADATSLVGIEDKSIESISALCSLEHFGLGRYGDPIDPDAWYKAMKSIMRVLSDGGDLYLSVPIGWEHLEYNAHRIFYPQTIIDTFNELTLVEFSSANDDGIEYNVDVHKYDDEKYNRGRRFGLFHFVK